MSILYSAEKIAWSLWGVELEGDSLSIKQIERSLNHTLSESENTFISRLNSTAALRSAKWNDIKEPKIVLQTAQLELNLLQGLAKISCGTGPLTLGTIFKFSLDDKKICQIRITERTIHLLDPNFDSNFFPQGLALLRDNGPLHGAALELCGIADWYRIYKVVEYLEEYFGKGERGLFEALPYEKAVLKNIKQTSQSLRHRARAFAEINNPIALDEAEKNLVRIIKNLIDNHLSSDSNAKPCFKVIPRTYSEDFAIGIKSPTSEDPDVGIAGEPI